ncbi:MAG: hypothetical protein SGI71_13610 [Verrucomicrobiota bacterium]|nr:hypothetical protein [Verrucomicrobiota bacterium]
MTKNSCTNGWLSPEGKFIECDGHGHIKAAFEKIGSPEETLEKRGWIKLSYRQWYGIKVNQRQLDFIFDWCHHNKLEIPEWVQQDAELLKENQS